MGVAAITQKMWEKCLIDTSLEVQRTPWQKLSTIWFRRKSIPWPFKELVARQNKGGLGNQTPKPWRCPQQKNVMNSNKTSGPCTIMGKTVRRLLLLYNYWLSLLLSYIFYPFLLISNLLYFQNSSNYSQTFLRLLLCNLILYNVLILSLWNYIGFIQEINI